MANANVVTWSGRSIYNNSILQTAGWAQPKYVYWGTANNNGTANQDTGSAFSDVNLFSPVPLASTTGSARIACTPNALSANQLADTVVMVGTLTANAAIAVTEVGLFDSVTVTPQATMNSSGNGTAVINATTTTFGVIGATGSTNLPASLNYYAQIENEVVLVTAGQNSNTLTVTRGQLGSTAASHANSVFITAGGDGLAHIANASIGGQTGNSAAANITYGNVGNMFVHADFPVINLANNDSIQFTLKVQLS